MEKPLFIVWQDSFIQGNNIIDEQHRGVLATINSLHYFLQQGQGLNALMPTVNIALSYLMFHSKTEEGILRAADYPYIEQFVQQNEALVSEFRQVCQQAIEHEDSNLLLSFLRKWWQSHLALHDEMTPFLNNCSGQFCRVD